MAQGFIRLIQFVITMGIIGGLIDVSIMEKKARNAMFHQVRLKDLNQMLGMGTYPSKIKKGNR